MGLHFYKTYIFMFPLFAVTYSTANSQIGINTTLPQSEHSRVAVALPFVDIFKTARPFQENSCTGLQLDSHGWPMSIPEGKCFKKEANSQGELIPYEVTENIVRVQTFMLERRSQFKNHPITEDLAEEAIYAKKSFEASVPQGKYTVLYDGEGAIHYDGYAKLVERQPGYDIIEITNNPDKRYFELSIEKTNSQNYIRNIKVIMPGGICGDNYFEHALSATECQGKGTFHSFVELVRKYPERTFFNPSFLKFHQPFKVMRLMNFMSASPRAPKWCYSAITKTYNSECVLTLPKQAYWEHQPQLDDASWGNSYLTPIQDWKGVPIEVIIRLANILKIDLWLTIPHYWTNHTIEQTAKAFKEGLNSQTKIYLEYGNEIFNGGFWAHHYTNFMGMKEKSYENCNMTYVVYKRDPQTGQVLKDPITGKYLVDKAATNLYWGRLGFQAQRSAEIFNIWLSYFAKDRSVFLMGSYVNDAMGTSRLFDCHVSLNSQEKKLANVVDGVAIAPYFRACPTRTSHAGCKSLSSIGKRTLSDIWNIDQVYELINNPFGGNVAANLQYDAFGLNALKSHLLAQKNSLDKLNKFHQTNLKMFAYEGGEHFEPNSNFQALGQELMDLINNNDPLMPDSQKLYYQDLYNNFSGTVNEKLSWVGKLRNLQIRKILEQANRDQRMQIVYEDLLSYWQSLGGDVFMAFTGPETFNQWGRFGIVEYLNQPQSETPKLQALLKGL